MSKEHTRRHIADSRIKTSTEYMLSNTMYKTANIIMISNENMDICQSTFIDNENIMGANVNLSVGKFLGVGVTDCWIDWCMCECYCVGDFGNLYLFK